MFNNLIVSIEIMQLWVAKIDDDWVLIYFPAKSLEDSEHFYSRMGSNAVSKDDTNVIATKHQSFLQNITDMADRHERQVKYL